MEGVKNFTNISDKEFVGMYGGDRATVPAGKTVAFTESIANHLAGQLAAKILIGMGKPWTDKGSKGERAKLVARILGGGDTGIKEDGNVGIIEPMKAIKTPKDSKGKTTDVDDVESKAPAPKEKEGEDEEFEDLPKDKDKDDITLKSFKELKELAKKKGLDLKKIGTSKAKLIRALNK